MGRSIPICADESRRTRAQPLSVHGWVYSISNGLIMDLNVTVSESQRH